MAGTLESIVTVASIVVSGIEDPGVVSEIVVGIVVSGQGGFSDIVFC